LRSEFAEGDVEVPVDVIVVTGLDDDNYVLKTTMRLDLLRPRDFLS
jgi:hypothetical protein